MSAVHDKRYWQRLAEKRKEEIQRLTEAVEGYENGQEGIYAIITAVVRKVGSVTISREEINEIMRNGIKTEVHVDSDKWEYTLNVWGESNGDEG